jgi:hypothetical protein
VLLGIVGHDQPDLATAEPMKTREFRLAIVQRTDGVRVLGAAQPNQICEKSWTRPAARASSGSGREMHPADHPQTPSPNCAAVSDARSGLAMPAHTRDITWRLRNRVQPIAASQSHQSSYSRAKSKRNAPRLPRHSTLIIRRRAKRVNRTNKHSVWDTADLGSVKQ